MAHIGTLKQEAKREAAKANSWIEVGQRWGYAAKGAIYFLIGLLAFLAASGNGGETTDQRGVIHRIGEQPFGRVLLVALGVGLLGYALFRLVYAIFNAECHKPLKRIGYFVSGLAYGGFGALALLVSLGGSAGGASGDSAKGVVQMPGGDWLVGLAGVVIGAVGVAQIINGLSGRFMKPLKSGEMKQEEQRFALWSGRVGLVSRGAVFLVTCWFLVTAAMHRDSGRVDGLDQSLSAIAHAPFGGLLLALVGLGLVAYGLYMFVEARYRHYEPVRG